MSKRFEVADFQYKVTLLSRNTTNFADDIGITPKSLANWKKYGKNPSMKTVKAICDTCNIEMVVIQLPFKAFAKWYSDKYDISIGDVYTLAGYTSNDKKIIYSHPAIELPALKKYTKNNLARDIYKSVGGIYWVLYENNPSKSAYTVGVIHIYELISHVMGINMAFKFGEKIYSYSGVMGQYRDGLLYIYAEDNDCSESISIITNKIIIWETTDRLNGHLLGISHVSGDRLPMATAISLERIKHTHYNINTVEDAEPYLSSSMPQTDYTSLMQGKFQASNPPLPSTA